MDSLLWGSTVGYPSDSLTSCRHSGPLPDEVGTVAAERRLFEEASDEGVLFDAVDVLLAQRSSSLYAASWTSSVRQRRRPATDSVCRSRLAVLVDVNVNLVVHHHAADSHNARPISSADQSVTVYVRHRTGPYVIFSDKVRTPRRTLLRKVTRPTIAPCCRVQTHACL